VAASHTPAWFAASRNDVRPATSDAVTPSRSAQIGVAVSIMERCNSGSATSSASARISRLAPGVNPEVDGSMMWNSSSTPMVRATSRSKLSFRGTGTILVG
jgi:hypothetical protein